MNKWYIASIGAINGSWSEPLTWCHNNLHIKVWHYHSEGVFEFKNESDFLIFMLKWS